MKFSKLLVVAAITTSSTVTFAGGFDGPFVQGALGWANSETELVDDGNLKWDDNNFVGKIAGGYSKSFGGFNLAGSIFYIIGDQDAGTINIDDSIGTATLTAKGSNTWGLTVEPGWNISESTLIYGKLSYVRTTGKLDYTAQDIGNPPESGTVKETYKGFGFGAGVKQKFTPNIYAFGEIEQINFSSKDGIKPNSLGVFVGVGYKF